MTLIAIKRSKKSKSIKKVDSLSLFRSFFLIEFYQIRSIFDLFRLNSNFSIIFEADLINFVATSQNWASILDQKND